MDFNINTEFKETRCQVTDWIHMSQDKVHCGDVLKL
jgi:hypothetical protein